MTSIEWTHRPGTRGESWNPIRARNLATGKIGWHCTHASDGCRFCYAERLNMNRRGLAFGTGLPYKPGHEQAAGSADGATGAQRDSVEIFLDDRTLAQPLRWRQPRTIFVCSMTDLFGAFVPDAMIDRVFAIAALCPQHTFIVLTKRSKRMLDYVSGREQPLSALRFNVADAAGRLVEDGDTAHDYVANVAWPLPNVWLGVSAERQKEADERIPDLLATQAAIRFASLEPLLGPIDLGRIVRELTFKGTICSDGKTHPLSWVIVGGESGPNARPMHPDWARSLRDQCAAAGVPFFFKQWGTWHPLVDRDIEDPDWRKDYSISLNDSRPDIAWLNLEGGRGFHGERFHVMRRLTKKSAGRLLDGVEHNGWPSSPLAGEDRAAPRAARLAALGEGSLS